VDDQTRREFLAEIEDLIEQMFAALDELRRQLDHVPLRREALARIFRFVHSIKGVAASASFNRVSELAHHVETLLERARAGRMPVADAFVDTLEDAANAISQSLSVAAGGSSAPPAPGLIKQLRELAEPDLRSANVNPELRLPDLPADIAPSVNEREQRLMLEAIREDARLYIVGASFDVTSFDKEFQGLREALARSGEVIATVPSTDSSRPDRISFRIVFAVDLELAELQQRLIVFPEIVVTELCCTQTGKVETAADEAPVNTLADGLRLASLSQHFIRIDLAQLDRLIASAHEVFRETDNALDFMSGNLAADSRAELQNLDAQLRQSLMALEEQIINLRMVSVGRTLQRARRAGRVAARVSGKQIEFSVRGGDLRIDKLLCDAIADPLLHLVRNAVDHGIETIAEREAAGKKPAGRVRIEARSEGGHAFILVSDDGRGIDRAVVARAAETLNLLESGAELSMDQSLRLIFRPGFSTMATVSDISGRGVGLDVVESAVEQAGGAVRVRTRPGKGAEFEIRLPATFGVLRAQIIVAGGYRYCLDASQIIDRCEINARQIESSARAKLLHWQSETLPLSSMNDLLIQSEDESARAGRLDVLICRVSAAQSEGGGGALEPSQHRAVVVDAIEGTQEVLVRSLGQHAARWIGIAGAAELRDGSVALVLDLSALLQ
jgi:two-component system chemotaxis sensor kinase CheA